MDSYNANLTIEKGVRMRSLIWIAAIPLMVVSFASFSANPTKKADKDRTDKNSAKQLAVLIGQLEGLAEQASHCRELYQVDLEVNQSRFRANMADAEVEAMQKGRSRLSLLERAQVEQKTLDDLKRNAKFPTCQEEARQGFRKTYPPLLKSWSKSTQLLAEAPLAEWLTLIDAVPSDQYEQEWSKFRASINSLSLKAMGSTE